MKRFLIGLIVGICIALPVSAIADSMVGKQIDMVAPVKLDGEYLSVNAIGIKGTTYAPVRALAESMGKEVGWIDGEVIIETPEKVEPINDPIDTPQELPTQSEGDGLVDQSEGYSIEEHIASLQRRIAGDREEIDTLRATIEFNKSINGSEEANQRMEETIERMEQQIAEFEQIIEELQAKQIE